MEWVPALVCALVGAVGGLVVPRLIARCPDPEPDPDEDPADFPDHVPFATLAARPGLAWRSALACAGAGAVVGGAVGWGWALLWLLPLLPLCCALTVIDYVTWYLPSRLVRPAWVGVAALLGVASAAVGDAAVLVWGVAGWLGLGGYYGLMRLISPRAMAGGDVRLGALLGLALGPFGFSTVLASVFAAALLSVLAYLPMKLRGNAIRRSGSRGPLKDHLPYGPFLVLGALVAIVVGQVLASI